MKRVLQIQAYAKLNLVLRVVGRREDGYHELQSVVTAVDLADEITLTVEGHEVTLDAPDLGPPERNLAVRAARALLDEDKPGVRIALRKRIPVGAGLGGGSSDAAAVLAGLNQLLSLGRSVEELKTIGITLGADVPFFLGPSPAWVEGIGERIAPLDVPVPAAFLILVPTFRCPTPDVYRAFDDLGLPISPSAPPEGAAAFENDLWPAAVHLYPQLASLRARLAEVAPLGVGMTGSGSALFAAFPRRADAGEARAQLAPRVEGELFVAAPIPWGYRNQG